MQAFLLLLFTFLHAQLSYAQVEEIRVAIYYDYAPWMQRTNEKIGLNNDLCEKLNALAKNKYKFVPEFLPRIRMNPLLENNEKIIVAWAHPNFFEDEKKEKYLWSSILANDVSYYISSAKKKFEYVDKNSFKDKTFSAVLGHKYPDLEPYIKSGELTREDTSSEVYALNKVATVNRSLDFALINRSSLASLENQKLIKPNKFYVSKTPRIKKLDRYFLVPKKYPELLHELDHLIKELNKDHQWVKHLRENGLEL